MCKIQKNKRELSLHAIQILHHGHLGIAKTVARIKERYMWKGIIQDVKDMVSLM